MGQILLKSQNNTATLVSNDFIDNCLVKLNEAQLKIYLYLLRHSQDQISTAVGDIADFFNYTENDVMRALSYMNRLGLLEDTDDVRSGDIRRDTSAQSDAAATPKDPDHFYPADKVNRFREREDVKQLLYITETHLSKELSLAETNTLLYIYDELGFSVDLIEYLVEYCVNCGKKSIRYIEKVALAWAAEGVSTVEEAKLKASGRYYKECYAMLRELGITSRAIVKTDMEYLSKWLDEYKVDFEVVLEACRRNLLSITKPSYRYIDSILKHWTSSGVVHLQDIEAVDAAYRARAQKGTGSRAPASGNFVNRFKNFKESGRDFNMLAQNLMKAQAPL